VARWHFSIFLTPKRWAQKNSGKLSQYLQSGWDLSPAWAGFDMPVDFYPEFIPAAHEWRVDLLHWQSRQGDNNIYIGLNEDEVAYFQVQLDMRKNAPDIMEALCEYAQAQDLAMVLMEEKRVIKPDRNILHRAARNSRAHLRYRQTGKRDG